MGGCRVVAFGGCRRRAEGITGPQRAGGWARAAPSARVDARGAVEAGVRVASA